MSAIAVLSLALGGVALAAGFSRAARRLIAFGLALAILGPVIAGEADRALAAIRPYAIPVVSIALVLVVLWVVLAVLSSHAQRGTPARAPMRPTLGRRARVETATPEQHRDELPGRGEVVRGDDLDLFR